MATAQTATWTTEIISRSFRRIRSSPLARNTGWMMAGNGLRLLIQVAYFVVIARSLGTSGYGAFVGASALVAFVAPFSGLGFGNLLVQHASRDRTTLRESWGNALAVIACSGSVLTVIVGFAGRALFRNLIPLPLILAVAAADLLLSPPLFLATSLWQVHDRLDRMAQLLAIWSGTRLAGACLLAILFRHPNAVEWAYVYAGATAVSSAIAICWVWPLTGAPKPCWRTIRRDARHGISYAVSLSAQNTYNDMDKTMLARMSTLDAVGIYAAAYRIIDVSTVPVRSLLAAAYANFFRAGKHGLASSCAYARRLLRLGIPYSAAAAICLLLFAPVFPHILGKEYQRTVEAVRWLAFLPVLKTAQYFLADALTGAGYQAHRMTLQIVAAVFNVAANILFIARWSWRGAAWTSLMADGFLAFTLLATVWLLLSARRGARTAEVALQ